MNSNFLGVVDMGIKMRMGICASKILGDRLMTSHKALCVHPETEARVGKIQQKQLFQ